MTNIPYFDLDTRIPGVVSVGLYFRDGRLLEWFGSFPTVEQAEERMRSLQRVIEEDELA